MTRKLLIFSVEIHPYIGIRETVLSSLNEMKMKILGLAACLSLNV